MSAQRAVPAARPTTARIAYAGLLAATLMACACGNETAPYVIASETAPDAQHVAAVRLTRCGTDWCESLWLGPSPQNARLVVTLPHGSERCTEIAWARDGKRVGFLINGYQLRLYDAHSSAPAGLVDLVPADSQPSTRIARGITFSDNGAAITFDDCPRDRSGCRPGIVAMR
jgi:hypothetical protein